jgi:glucokinase
MMLLAGDIGGTKTSLALYSSEEGVRRPLAAATFGSTGEDFAVLVARFLEDHDTLRPTHACFGVAGPVQEGRAKVTNLPWVIDGPGLCRRFGWQGVRLLNDLEATAHGVLALDVGQRRTLREGTPAATGTIAVIAPGTGLGMAFLDWDGGRYRICASEGGHAGFAPSGEQEAQLLQALLPTTDHVSWEWVLSGPALPRIYGFFKARRPEAEPASLAEALARAEDPAPLITQAALTESGRCELCVETLRLFVRILGAVAGDFALQVLATGGVYLGGGIPPRILPALENGELLVAFDRKGPMRELVRQIPVHVILEPQTALLGAARCGLDPLTWD